MEELYKCIEIIVVNQVNLRVQIVCLKDLGEGF